MKCPPTPASHGRMLVWNTRRAALHVAQNVTSPSSPIPVILAVPSGYTHGAASCQLSSLNGS